MQQNVAYATFEAAITYWYLGKHEMPALIKFGCQQKVSLPFVLSTRYLILKQNTISIL